MGPANCRTCDFSGNERPDVGPELGSHCSHSTTCLPALLCWSLITRLHTSVGREDVGVINPHLRGKTRRWLLSHPLKIICVFYWFHFILFFSSITLWVKAFLHQAYITLMEKKRNRGGERTQRLLLLSNPICFTRREGGKREGGCQTNENEAREREREGWMDGGGGEVLFREGIRGRQAGGLGSKLVHVWEGGGGRQEQANVCCIYMCLCACVRSLCSFSFLCLTTEWEKKRRERQRGWARRNTDRGSEEEGDLKRESLNFLTERTRNSEDFSLIFFFFTFKSPLLT